MSSSISSGRIRSLVAQAIEANRGSPSLWVRVRLEDAGAVCEVRADWIGSSRSSTNLLSNAIKFSHRIMEVVVTATEKGTDVARISIRNHGAGISADFKPRIFERFAQADATNTRQKGGTGLGLSIVKQIVDRLGGDVGFADAPGGGTIFHVELPCWETVTNMAIELDAQPVLA